MALEPNALELRARALTDLRMGLPIRLGAAGTTLVMAVETLTPERLSGLRALGNVQIVVSAWRAETLRVHRYDEGLARITVPNHANLRWCLAMADPTLDMEVPFKGPFQTHRGGETDLAEQALQLAKDAHLLPAVLITDVGISPGGLTHVDKDTGHGEAIKAVAAAKLPLSACDNSRLHIYRPDDGGEEHYAVVLGNPTLDEAPLVRLHSACFTGDVLGSLKCDCGPQLHGALAQMAEVGSGILLYLNQEGRGIGLANKMRAYALQDQGFDTVEANHRLGFEDDERDFQIGAKILKWLGRTNVQLLTNNPKKVDRLQSQGITVSARIPLQVGQNSFNQNYLRTKAEKSGHFL